MKGYVLFQEDVFDKEGFENYKVLSTESIKNFDGEFVVRGGDIQTLEGNFQYERVVIIAFPSIDQARAWYDSEEYSDARQLRLKISKGQAILIHGI